MHGFSRTNSTSSIEPGDIFQVHLSWERPSGRTIPRPRGSVPVACIPSAYVFKFTSLGAPLGLHHPHAARARPSGMYLPAFIQVDLLFMLNLPTAIACSVIASPEAFTQARRWCMGPSLPLPTNLSGRALARGMHRARHLIRPSVPSLHPDQPAAGRRQ